MFTMIVSAGVFFVTSVLLIGITVYLMTLTDIERMLLRSKGIRPTFFSPGGITTATLWFASGWYLFE